MRYYSEQLDKFFNTEKECIEAESEVERKAEIEKKKQEEKAIADQKLKKELAKKVDDAETALTEAYDSFKKKKEEADNFLKDAKIKYEKILDDAASDVRAAERNKMEAIKEFNSKFGVYSKVYNGDKAIKEMTRINSFLTDLFNFNGLDKFWW